MLLSPRGARELFKHALKNHYAVLAVNADSPAAVSDCLVAALGCDAPIVIEASLWQLEGRSFGAGNAIIGMARYLASLATLAGSQRFLSIPVVFHIDHIKGPQTEEILAAGLRGLVLEVPDGSVTLHPSTISLDSSDLSQQQNIRLITALCDQAARAGVDVTLEMEAGIDAGLTPPDVTRNLLGEVERQHPGRVWLWAPGLGTKHGFSDDGYPAFSVETVASQLKLAQQITKREVGLALHGSSGLSEAALQTGVAAGIVKVNWSSQSLLLRSAAAAEYYRTREGALSKDHPDFKVAAMDNGVQSYVGGQYVPVVSERIRLLGSAGQASAFVSQT